MKINKAKASEYDTVGSEWIANYIQEYAYKIFYMVNNVTDENGSIQANERLINSDRSQLKAIASELETVLKRLNWVLEGKY